MSPVPNLPEGAREALHLIALNALDGDDGAEKLVALLQPLRPPDPANPEWRLFVAHRDIEFTYACSFAEDAVDPLLRAEILEEGLAAGRVILQLSDRGLDICRTARQRPAASPQHGNA